MNQFLTTRQFAERLGVHPDTLLRWRRRGFVAAVQSPTGRLRFPATELERLNRVERA